MDFSSVAAFYGSVDTAGVALAAFIVGIELWVTWLLLRRAALGIAKGSRPVSFVHLGPGRLGPMGVALAAGAAVFAPVIAWIQVPLQNWAVRWAVGNLATADQRLWSIPAMLLSGLVQEPAKLVAALAGAAACAVVLRRPSRAGVALFLGAAAGAGFGGIEAAAAISSAVRTMAPFQAFPLMVLGERASAVLFHVASAGLATFAWVGFETGPPVGVEAAPALADAPRSRAADSPRLPESPATAQAGGPTAQAALRRLVGRFLAWLRGVRDRFVVLGRTLRRRAAWGTTVLLLLSLVHGAVNWAPVAMARLVAQWSYGAAILEGVIALAAILVFCLYVLLVRHSGKEARA